jgi:hypothetical protein
MKKAREQFMQAVQAGQAALFDAVGHRLAPGQLVIFTPPPNVWRWLIADVVPVVDPNVPPGVMRVMLKLDVPLNVQAGQQISNMLVVGEQEQEQAQLEPEPAVDETAMPPVVDGPFAEPPAPSPDATGHSDD